MILIFIIYLSKSYIYTNKILMLTYSGIGGGGVGNGSSRFKGSN